ncbi:MAG: VIT and VWA domain-containing protein [Bacteroidota bacterium]
MKRIRIIFILCQLCLLILPTAHTQSQHHQTDQLLAPYFYFLQNKHRLDELPLKDVSANVQISGTIAYVELQQVYVNSGKKVLEAVYVFPGSTHAALHGMEMVVGQRTIKADIEERKQARRLYEEAKEAGKVSSLLEQQRPNVFEMNVANIGPGETITIRIRYTEMIQLVDESYEFILPTTVGPRYSERNQIIASTKNQWVSNPYLEEHTPMTYGYHVNLILNAGVPIKKIKSPSHDVDFKFDNATICRMDLRDTYRQNGNRDFIVRYTLKDKEISSGLLLHEGKDENFFSLIIQPPQILEVDKIPPREFVFVVDVSGSMEGFPSKTANKLMSNLLNGLRMKDRFNVMTFSSGNHVLSSQSLPPTDENIGKATRLLRKKSGGGTQLYNALRDAIEMESDGEMARSIVIITDGYIDDEGDVFNLIRSNLYNANIYAFGIGTSVNRYLVEGIAFTGQGKEYVVTTDLEASEKAGQFVNDITATALTNIRVDFGNAEVYDLEPMYMPDVLSSRPGIIFGKYKGEFPEVITIKGQTDEPVEYIVARTGSSSHFTEGLPYLWARTRVKYLSDFQSQSSNIKSDEIIDLGLKYGIMTAYTSFIAIDEEGDLVNRKSVIVKQPLPLPAGVTNDAIGGAGNSYRSRLRATGAVSRATNAAISLKLPMSNVEVAGSQIVLDWQTSEPGPFTIQVKDIFDQVLYKTEVEDGVVLNLDDMPGNSVGLYVIRIYQSSNRDYSSDDIGIKRLDQSVLIKRHIPLDYLDFEPQTLEEYLEKAAFFRSYDLFMDELTMLVLAYNEWPSEELADRILTCFAEIGY